MKTVDNLIVVLTKSYTAWAIYVNAALNLFFELGLNQTLSMKYQLGLAALILLARSIKQESISGSSSDEEDPDYAA